jgi:hypothetical protein
MPWTSTSGRARREFAEHLRDRVFGDLRVGSRSIGERVGRDTTPDRLLRAGVEDVYDDGANL